MTNERLDHSDRQPAPAGVAPVAITNASYGMVCVPTRTSREETSRPVAGVPSRRSTPWSSRTSRGPHTCCGRQRSSRRRHRLDEVALLAHAAVRAAPGVGYGGPWRPGREPLTRVADRLVVRVSAPGAAPAVRVPSYRLGRGGQRVLDTLGNDRCRRGGGDRVLRQDLVAAARVEVRAAQVAAEVREHAR